MKALVLQADNKLKLVERPRPTIEDQNDVLVRVVQTGICGTDRSILVGKFTAKPGTILGHESVGIVEEAGSGALTSGFVPGNRVIINPTMYCGECSACLSGKLNFCNRKVGNEIGIDRDGAFAEYIRLPAKFCHHVPERMSFDRAVMVEPLACALNNLEAARLSPGESVLVIGGGPMGIISAMLALALGAKVTLVEVDPFRRLACNQILTGAQFTLADPNGASRLEEADVVVDSVGNLLADALRYAKVAGRVVILGYNSHASVTVKPLDILMRGLSIIGAGDYNSQIFPRAIELAKNLPLEKVISARFSISDYDQAFGCLAQSGSSSYEALKVLIQPNTLELSGVQA